MRAPLAPMDLPLRALTAALLPLPLLFFAMALQVPELSVAGVAVIAVYLGIWTLGRPRAFEVEGHTLTLRWPLRQREVDLRDLDEIELIDMRAFRAELGTPLRVGAGGLWGVFGWLVTPQGWVRAYISRRDGLLLLRFKDGARLLISPEAPERFAQRLHEASDAPR